VQLLYSNDIRRQAEQVEAALQQWDLKENQPPNKQQRFSLHQRWAKNINAKACAGHVLLVEVTTAFFEKHKSAVFVLKGQARGKLDRVGTGGSVQ
jgi:hypothetical protein